MSGGVFRVRGATGQAPTTVWFGNLPDRLNMLLPQHDTAPHNYDSLVSADYLNLWTPWNLSYGGGANSPTASFGGFTTAPDGTITTAQQLVESATNTRHFACASSLGTQHIPGQMRLAGFFKYAGRRVALTIAASASFAYADQTPFGGGASGVRAIFDLQNGQIAVDSTKFGGFSMPLWQTFPAQIISKGNGWYLCYLDVFINNNLAGNQPAFGSNIFCYVELDNGTGTNAASLTYTGNGTSGVYGWRTNMLPPATWAMNDTAFFEDFNDNTRANFDLTNTLDPTKTWFIQNGTPYVPNSFDPVTPIADLVVSNSVLNIKPTIANIVTLMTFAALNQNSITAGYVGQGWKLPALFECRLRWDYDNDTRAPGGISFWTWTIEWLTRHPDPSLSQGPAPVGLVGREMDFWESPTALEPNSTMIDYYVVRQVPNSGIGRSSIGATKWTALAATTVGYLSGQVVTHNGVYYKSLVSSNTDTPPSANWTVYVGPPAMITNDWNQFQTVQCLVVPYAPGDIGKMIQFLNGIFASVVDVYSPTIDRGWAPTPDTFSHASDGQTFPIVLGASPIFNTYFDWVRVTQ